MNEEKRMNEDSNGNEERGDYIGDDDFQEESNIDLRQIPEMIVGKLGVRRYPSDNVGLYIVDAITGAKYPWRVGTKDENRFFKVKDVGNIVGFKSKNYGYRVSHKLYYETPTDYMKHRGVKLDKITIQNWYNRLKEEFPNQYDHLSQSLIT